MQPLRLMHMKKTRRLPLFFFHETMISVVTVIALPPLSCNIDDLIFGGGGIELTVRKSWGQNYGDCELHYPEQTKRSPPGNDCQRGSGDAILLRSFGRDAWGDGFNLGAVGVQAHN